MISEVKATLRGACSVRLPPSSLFLFTSFVGLSTGFVFSHLLSSNASLNNVLCPSHQDIFRHDFPFSLLFSSVYQIQAFSFTQDPWIDCLSARAPSHVCTCTFTCVPVYLHMCVHTPSRVCLNTFTCVHMYLHMCACAYVSWMLVSGCLLSHSPLYCFETGPLKKPTP